jgi:hypothetical protein
MKHVEKKSNKPEEKRVHQAGSITRLKMEVARSYKHWNKKACYTA